MKLRNHFHALAVVLAAAPRTLHVRADARNPVVALEELRHKVVDLLDRAKAIKNTAEAEHRPLTDEEKNEVNAILDAIDATKDEIAQSERILAHDMDVRSAQPRRTEPADAPPPAAAPQAAAVPARSGERRQVTGGMPNGASAGSYGFRSFGEFALSVKSAARGSVDPRLMSAGPSTYGSEGVGEDGGFAVPPDMRTEILSKVMGEDSLLQYTDQQTSSSNQLVVPKDETTPWQTTGGVQAYWENEGSQLKASKIELQSTTVRLNKLTALVPVTSELLEDAPALSNYLRRKAPEKMTFKVNDAIVNGTGSGQPQGILNAGCKVSVDKESAQTNLTLVFANLAKMWSRMYGPCRRRAIWIVNQDVEPQLTGLAFPNLGSGTVVPVYMPPGGLSASPYGTLLGRPIVPSETAAQLGYEGDIILTDLSQYLSVSKTGGIRSDVSIHLWFDYDVTAFRFIMRLGGQSWWTSPVKRAHGSNALSSVVTLADRHA